MRRTDKEIKDRTIIDAIVRRSQVCRLGFVDGDVPYVLPMSFGYDGRFLYFHCAPQGRKLDILRANNRVCFEFDIVESIIEGEEACRWGIRYQSVVGTGTAWILEDLEEKRQALAEIMAQYTTRKFAFPDHAVKATVVFKIAMETITGKQTPR